jgi:hypothetical protein
VRDILAGMWVAFWIVAYGMRAYRPDLDRMHSHYLVVVGGLTGIVAGTIGAGTGGFLGPISGTFSIDSKSNGWEAFLLVVSLLLIMYTAWQEYRATAYAGLYGLITFVVVTGSGGGIGGWPLLLTIVGAIALVASLFGPQLKDRMPPASSPPAQPPPPAPPAP